jgi:hypothetical protein
MKNRTAAALAAFLAAGSLGAHAAPQGLPDMFSVGGKELEAAVDALPAGPCMRDGAATLDCAKGDDAAKVKSQLRAFQRTFAALAPQLGLGPAVASEIGGLEPEQWMELLALSVAGPATPHARPAAERLRRNLPQAAVNVYNVRRQCASSPGPCKLGDFSVGAVQRLFGPGILMYRIKRRSSPERMGLVQAACAGGAGCAAALRDAQPPR